LGQTHYQADGSPPPSAPLATKSAFGKVACGVLVSFGWGRYAAAMQADKLTLADPSDLADALVASVIESMVFF
jgi:hypothetical protein